MKNIKKHLLVMLFSIVMTVEAVLPAEAAATSNSDDNTLESETLIDFEDTKQTLASIRISGIARAELCNDKTYVTQGKQCLHICPSQEEIEDGSYYSGSTFFLYPRKKSYLDAEYVAVDIYNPTEYSRAVVFSYGEFFKEYTIEPGENTIWCWIDRARLDYSNSGIVKDFILSFRGESKETGSLDLYIDNFRCYYAKVDYKKYTNDFTQNTWYSFEETGDLVNFYYHGTLISTFSRPVFSINRDIRYIKSGSGSLQVDFRNTLSGVQDTRSFRTRDNMLGDLNQYLDNLEGYYLGFPIYNPNSCDITCSVRIFSNYNDESYSTYTTIPAGSWSDSDFVISLADLKAKFTGSGFDIMTIAFSIGGLPDGGTIYLDSIGVYPVE